jgi:hypothetical protein
LYIYHCRVLNEENSDQRRWSMVIIGKTAE